MTKHECQRYIGQTRSDHAVFCNDKVAHQGGCAFKDRISIAKYCESASVSWVDHDLLRMEFSEEEIAEALEEKVLVHRETTRHYVRYNINSAFKRSKR